MSLVDRILGLPELTTEPPVLVDVGAAQGLHPKWRQIAKYSICVAFEADVRELASVTSEAAGFRKLTTYNAIAAERPAESEPFHLTASPFCSSRLRPKTDALRQYAFAPLFEVESTVERRALDFPGALAELGLERLDWFKARLTGNRPAVVPKPWPHRRHGVGGRVRAGDHRRLRRRGQVRRRPNRRARAAASGCPTFRYAGRPGSRAGWRPDSSASARAPISTFAIGRHRAGPRSILQRLRGREQVRQARAAARLCVCIRPRTARVRVELAGRGPQPLRRPLRGDRAMALRRLRPTSRGFRWPRSRRSADVCCGVRTEARRGGEAARPTAPSGPQRSDIRTGLVETLLAPRPGTSPPRNTGSTAHTRPFASSSVAR